MWLKSFCPWCVRLGENTKGIAMHLWEVHYKIAVMCNICQAFACMSVQRILDPHSGCKAKCDKVCVECEGPTEAPKKKEVLETKGGIPVAGSSCQEVIRSGRSLYNFHLVMLVNLSQFTPLTVLPHPRFILEQDFTQSDELSFFLFIVKWCSCQTIISHFI